jgi:hypothetical protein
MRRRVPTVEESIPRALVGLAPSSRELYAFYLRLLAERHGRRKIDQLAASDITELGVWAQAMAVRRSDRKAGGLRLPMSRLPRSSVSSAMRRPGCSRSCSRPHAGERACST